jgi:hypothetical protein
MIGLTFVVTALGMAMAISLELISEVRLAQRRLESDRSPQIQQPAASESGALQPSNDIRACAH